MLVALAFLGILMPVLISALLVASRAGNVAERRSVAMQLCENRMSELMLDNAWSSSPSSGDFGEAWPGYRWEMRQGDWQSGAMTELTLSVFFKVQGQEHDVALTSLAN
jgi:type II secretory pathway pseudopilin PulG